MKILDKYGDKILGALVEMVFAGIAAVLSPIVFNGNINPYIYIWLISIVLFVILIIRDIINHQKRPFMERFRNEEEAMLKIRKIILDTKSTLFVLSKVGTSIFFAFPEYSQLLEKGQATIQVLIANPNDEVLLKLMDKIYVHQRDVSNRWSLLFNQIRVQLDSLFNDGLISKDIYYEVTTILQSDLGYKTLILASVRMWNAALEMANHRLSSQGKTYTVHGLEIRSYETLPDIKAWISDNRACAVGNYDALHLGRDNPVDIYKPGSNRNIEHWQFQNIIAVWKYKFDTANTLVNL